MKTPQFGLRSTVRLFDTVVDQNVNWCVEHQWTPIDVVAPTHNDRPLGFFRWQGEEVEIRDDAGQVTRLSGSEDQWHWTDGNGIDVQMDKIQMQRARRTSGEAWGDVALLVLMLALMVGVAQLNTLFGMIVGQRAEETVSLPPSPELIARLLKQEFGGQEQGRVAVVKRPEMKRKAPSYYMPAGAQGPMERIGGGPKAGEHVLRHGSTDDTSTEALASAEPEPPVLAKTEKAGLEAPPLQRLGRDVAVAAKGKRGHTFSPQAMERFVGWGFPDWLDAAEVSDPDRGDMEQRLQLAHQILRIDPDDPFAMLTIGNYAYLSENYELCRQLYARYLELYPDDAAGWNNLALTFKRTGHYEKEEDLYRMALALEPENFFTKNNLAVNLAHQGRFEEAHALMSDLRLRADERPYADLHHAKIAAAEGRDRRAYKYLKRALTQVGKLTTSHHIEFRQDIRLDPSFDRMRNQTKFRRLLSDAYGEDTPIHASTPYVMASEVAGG